MTRPKSDDDRKPVYQSDGVFATTLTDYGRRGKCMFSILGLFQTARLEKHT
jgi:hypothetical protein